MANYSDLETDEYYLIQETEEDEIILIEPIMETETSVLIVQYGDFENTYWRKKDQPIYEIVEQLTEEQVEEYESIFEEEDEDMDDDDEEDDDDEWERN